MKKFVLIIVLPIILFGGGLVFLNLQKEKTKQNAPQNTTQQSSTQQADFDPNATTVTWEFTGEEWRAIGKPPACANPLVLGTPVDIDLVTALLYPGQTRTNQYKPHGGFAFNSSTENKVVIKAPLDAHLVKASRYIEQGETQYLLIFINQCGIMYRFDHLLELAPKYQEIIRKLPEAKVNDSRTTPISPPIYVLGGEVIGTKIGFANNSNVTVDFGVYDLRKKNSVTKPNDKEYAPYGICWLNNFSPAAASRLKSLPARDQASGKTSDYCK